MPNYINGSSITSSEIEMFLAMSDSTSLIIDMNCCAIFSIFKIGTENKVVYWDRVSMKGSSSFLSKMLPKILLSSCGSISLIPCLDTTCKAASISQGTYHYIIDLAEVLAKDVAQYVKQSIINSMDCKTQIDVNTQEEHPVLPSPTSPSISLYHVPPPCC